MGSSPPSRELNNLSRTVEQEMGLHRSKVVGQLDPMDILFDFLANLTILAGCSGHKNQKTNVNLAKNSGAMNLETWISQATACQLHLLSMKS